jgi:hypothetical protein
LLYKASSFFNSDLVNHEEEMEVVETENQEEPVVKPDKLSKRISLVEYDITNLRGCVARHRIKDSLVTAYI